MSYSEYRTAYGGGGPASFTSPRQDESGEPEPEPEEEPSYIDYDAFLAADFDPYSFANTLVLSTNDISDESSLDLTTPLSRVLFDVQEIDTHIHNLTSRHALPLLSHARGGIEAGTRVLDAVETHVEKLSDGYGRLDRDVLGRWENAEETRVAAENAWRTVRLTRAVGRCLGLGRQLETQIGERAITTSHNPGGIIRRTGSPLSSQISSESSASSSSSSSQSLLPKEDHRLLVPAAHTLLQLRRLFEPVDENDEGYGLNGVSVIRTLRSELVSPTENVVRNSAQTILGNFNIAPLFSVNATASSPSSASGSPTRFTQAVRSSSPAPSQVEETKAQLISAVTTLYLLSPIPRKLHEPRRDLTPVEFFKPEFLLSALRSYILATISNAATALTRGLASLSVLDRALHEVSLRCQNIAALEIILKNLRPPEHPFLDYSGADHKPQEPRQSRDPSSPANMLHHILRQLDTTSLPSFFWRSIASSLASRVPEILSRGGASARALRVANRDRLADLVRGCVANGSRIPVDLVGASAQGVDDREISGAGAATDTANGAWERETMVMLRAIIGPLNRG